MHSIASTQESTIYQGPFQIEEGNKIIIHDIESNKNVEIPGNDDLYVPGFSDFENVTMGHLAYHSTAKNHLIAQVDNLGTHCWIVNPQKPNIALDPRLDNDKKPIPSYVGIFAIDQDGFSTCGDEKDSFTLNFNSFVRDKDPVYKNAVLEDYRWHANNGSLLSVTREATSPDIFIMLIDPVSHKEIHLTIHSNGLNPQTLSRRINYMDGKSR